MLETDIQIFPQLRKIGIKVLSLALILLLGTAWVSAATRISTATGGNWNSGATWVGGVAPGTSDDIIIATTGGNSVTLTANAACVTLTINVGAILNGSSFEMQVKGAGTSFINLGTFNPQTGTFFYTNAAAVDIVAGTYNNLKFGGTGVKNIPDGVFVNGNFTGSGGAPTMTTGTLTISGAWTLSTAFVAGSGKVHYNGEGAIRANTYYDLEISGAGLKTTSGNIVIDGTLTVNPGAEFQTSSSTRLITLNKTGTPLINNGTITSGIIVYAGNGDQEMAPGVYNRITLSGTGIKTIPSGALVEVNNQFIVGSPMVLAGSASAISGGILSGAGDITMGSGSITILSTFTNTGIFEAGTGTIIYGSAGNQTMSARPYYNIETSGAGIKTFASGLINVNGDLIVGVETSLASSTDLYIEGDIIGSGTLNAGGSSGIIALKGDWLHSGTFNMALGVVLYEGINQQIRVQDYNVLQLANGVKTINDNLVINKKLEILSGTLNIGTHTLEIAGGGSSVFTNDGVLAGTGTVLFSSASTQTIPATTYPKLEFSGAAKTFAAGTTITVLTDWIVNSTVTMTSTQNAEVGGDILGSGDITMGSGIIRVAGNWTNNGTFTKGSGTIIFEGSTQIIPSYTYSSLEIHNSGLKSLAGDITVERFLIVNSPATLNTGAFKITLPNSGTPLVNSGTLTGNGTVHYSASGTQIVDPSDYYNLELGTGAKTIEDGVNLNIANDLTITGTTTLDLSAGLNIGGDLLGTAILNLNSGTITLGGDWLKTGAFNAGTGTVNYNGVNQTISAQTYYNLQTSNAGVKTLEGNTDISNVLTINTGSTLNLSSFNLTLAGSGTPLVNNATLVPATSTVSYSSGSSTTITAANYYNLNGSGGDRILANSGTIGIASTFTPGAGLYSVNGSTVNFNGLTPQTIPNFTFNELVISEASVKSILGGTTINVYKIAIQSGAELDIQDTALLNISN